MDYKEDKLRENITKKRKEERMKELTELCKSCLGCNRLEDLEFEGVNECKYMKNEKEPKYDCQYYRHKTKDCDVLYELVCTHKKCTFYKERRTFF